MFWNYDFSFIKKYELNNDSLTIQFEFVSEKGMPFMLGYHPAFNIKGKDVAYCSVNDQKITIDAILKVGSNAYPVFESKQTFTF